MTTLLNHLTQSLGRSLAEKALSDWEIIPCNGGEVMKRGCEVHVCAESGKERIFVQRGNIRNVFGPILEEFGFITTRLGKEMEKERSFVERGGFKKTWSDERFDYFMATELPFAGRLKCK